MSDTARANSHTKRLPKSPLTKSRESCSFIVTLCVLLAITVILVVPRFVEVFEEFDSDLPTITVFFLQTKIPIAASLVLVAMALLAKEVLLKQRNKLTHSINLIFVVLVGMMSGCMAVSLILPLKALFQSVQ